MNSYAVIKTVFHNVKIQNCLELHVFNFDGLVNVSKMPALSNSTCIQGVIEFYFPMMNSGR